MDEEYVPPSTKDIADWSKSCIGILELTETMGKTIDDTLNTMKSDRDRVRRRRDFILNKYQDTEVTLDKTLAALPTDLTEYKKLLTKKDSMKAAEEQQRKLLGLTRDADDDTLVEESTRRLRAYLSGETDEAPKSQLLELNMEDIDKVTNNNNNNNNNTTDSLSNANANNNNNNNGKKEEEEEEGETKESVIYTQDKIENNDNNGGKNNNGDNEGSKIKTSTKSKKKGRGKKSKKKMKSSRKVGPLSPIRENKIKQQPAAHDRLLAILQQEEERDVFRAQTLKALEVNNPERIEEMKRIFAKERREANKVMEQILSDFKPSKRKSEPVTPLSSKERREKYNKSTPKSTRNSSNKGGKSFFPSPKSSNSSIRGQSGGFRGTMSAPSITQAAHSRKKHKPFKAKNMMPGSFAPPSPPNLPDNIDKKLIDLHGEQARTDPIDGSSIDRGVKDLIHDHSTQVDLNFPDLEMYRRSYHDRAKWNEPKY